MIWLYEKDGDALRLETRYDNSTLQYILTIQRPDGSETERYGNLEEFRQRLLALERSLSEAEWQRSGAPVLDPDGWPDIRPGH